MPNDLLSRNKMLNIPQTIENKSSFVNTVSDRIASKQAFATAAGEKFNRQREQEKIEEQDTEWVQISKIPEAASDLIVITKTKKLGAYVLAVTQKSPAKFRAVFVSRMQNFCLDAVQDMLNANFIRAETQEQKKERAQYQTNAIIKLKMLAYIALLAENAKCILTRQYKQISLQTGECIHLILAWKKSDQEKWRHQSE